MSRRRKTLIYGVSLPLLALVVYALYDSANKVVLGTPEEIEAAVPPSLRTQPLEGNEDVGKMFFVMAHISNEAQINRGMVSPSLARCLRLIDLAEQYSSDPRPPRLTWSIAASTPLFGGGPSSAGRLSHPGAFHEAIGREFLDVADQLLAHGNQADGARALSIAPRFLLKPVPALYSRYSETNGRPQSSSGLPPLSNLCQKVQALLTKRSLDPERTKLVMDALPTRDKLRDHYAAYLKQKLADLQRTLVDVDEREQREFVNGRLNVPQMMEFVSGLMAIKIADLDKPFAKRNLRFERWQIDDFNAFAKRYEGRMTDGWEGFTFRYEPNGRGRAVLNTSDTLDLATDFHTVLSQVELTRAWLACKIFKLKFQRRPSTLQELVDASILKSIPADPFDGKTLRYDPKRGLLWVVYQDCRDDHGTHDLVSTPVR